MTDPAKYNPFPATKLGFRRTEAANFIGVSPTKFDQLVKDGRMPSPVRFDGIVVWDGRELIEAFDRLRVSSFPTHSPERRSIKRRRPGTPKLRLRGIPWSEEFMAAYAAALNYEADHASVGSNSPETARARTWRWLCIQYLSSAEYKRLQPATRNRRRAILEETYREPLKPGCEAVFGGMPLSEMKGKAIRVLRDRKAAMPFAADIRLKAVRRVFSYAIECDLVGENPARNVPLFRQKSAGLHTWTPEQVQQLQSHHTVGTKARLALDLMLYLGVRRSDVILLGPQHISRGWLRFVQTKTASANPVPLELPILPVLQATLDASEVSHLTFLTTEYGKSFSVNGFGNQFAKWCQEAGLPDCCRTHGLRKAGATIAAERGATEHQLMAIYGWQTLQQAEVYTRKARRRKLAAASMHLIDLSEEG